MASEESARLPAGWFCDTCGGQAADPGGTLVVWRFAGGDGGGAVGDFKIVHKGPCDPQCEAGYVMSLGIGRFTGPRGPAMLLSWLGVGPRKGGHPRAGAEDLDAYVDLARRFHLPGYEEARRCLGYPGVLEWPGASKEAWPYTALAVSRPRGPVRGGVVPGATAWSGAR